MRSAIPPGAVCVAILADSGERYVDTIYSDAWVAEHFGDVGHLWKGAADHGDQQPAAMTI